eukprot:PhF_6_TR18709/c0_g1_i1/m.27339
MSNRLLLIFGLRGTLLERLSLSETPTTLSRRPTHTFTKYNLWLRPGAQHVLSQLSKTCDLAIWSATPQRNTVPLVQTALPDIPFQFIWYRDHTIPDTLRRSLTVGTSENDRHDVHGVLKDLNKVYKEHGGKYTAGRTVIVDDTITKSRLHAGNCVLLPTYDLIKVSQESPEALDTVDPVLQSFQTFVEEKLLNVADVRSLL